jgi:hypothetical protein
MGISGEVIFMDRHHRLTNTASLTSQSTWNVDGGAEPVMNTPFVYDESWRNIINTGSIDVGIRGIQEVGAVWSADSVIALTNGEETTITVSTSDPFVNAITPEQGVDYELASGTVTITLTRTSGASATIELTAGGSGAVLTSLQLRAQPVTVAYSVKIAVTDEPSVADYGYRSYPTDLPWCNQYDADAVLQTAVSYRAQPLATVTASFLIGEDDDRATALLPRNMSDRVTIVEPETQLNHEFFIENFVHDLSAEFDHKVTFGTEMIASGISPQFRFDTTGAGFGDGKFGNGTDDPALMFRFDNSTVGHRFDSGLFAT